MSVSRNTSRCVIAASILVLSSTTFISSALAQSAFTGGTINISGEQTITDDFDLATPGTVQINIGGNATLTGNIVTNNNMLTFSTLGTGLVTGNIDGGSSLIDKTGSGTLVIDGQMASARVSQCEERSSLTMPTHLAAAQGPSFLATALS